MLYLLVILEQVCSILSLITATILLITYFVCFNWIIICLQLVAVLHMFIFWKASTWDEIKVDKAIAELMNEPKNGLKSAKENIADEQAF